MLCCEIRKEGRKVSVANMLEFSQQPMERDSRNRLCKGGTLEQVCGEIGR